MKEVWLIDGYNLLHDPAAQKTPSGHKISKETLLGWIAGFAALEARSVIIVFDGLGNEEELRPYQTHSFKLVYSKKLSADTYIEKYLYENRNLTRLMVVTKDHAISNMARGGGARVMGTGDFMMLVHESRKENSELLHQNEVKSHGFNRPFDKKLKNL